ncbi:hypothetical protein K6V98_07150 [Collinsella sp. AGMB00827]|uniref:Uncharacterized protein n=1 Tax=Collinsella ureilytica TaxID=2869515 RepID=A0ABS7ML85_9ACTN|nr:hypothetical protein [Collinsella urealyticum]MBY4798119.1 hypothetical protein [Collinsella urealyticum]
MYDLGDAWHDGTAPAKPGDTYTALNNHWFFVRDLRGIYRFTVKLVFDKDTEIGPLKNTCEAHTCSSVIYPSTISTYDGVGSISKKALKAYGVGSLNQGKLPWQVEVRLNAALPSENRFVYEFFYYGDRDALKAEQGLHVASDLPEGTFDELMKSEQVGPRANLCQSWVPGSLKARTTGDGAHDVMLDTQVMPVLNAAGNQVGELVQKGGFTESATYVLEFQTRIRDLFDQVKASPTGEYDGRYINTEILTIGSGKTLKAIPASGVVDTEGRILSKYAMEFDTDLSKLDQVSRSGWESPYRDFVTNKPLGDKNRTFNYRDHTAYFRIDVNPDGIDLADYAQATGKDPATFDQLTIKDSLSEGCSLVPLAEGGSEFFALYEAQPSSFAHIDKSISSPDSPAFATLSGSGDARRRVQPADARVSFNKDDLT